MERERSSFGLNLFQRLTRRWDAVHPYNAAQVLKVAGRCDIDSVTSAWMETLPALGLGRVRACDGSRFRHEILNGESAHYPPRVLPPETCLEQFLTAEMNRPFADPDEPPFRPFVLNRGDECLLGIVYHHWVADSVAVRLVMREWFARCVEPSAASGRPVRVSGEGYWRLFGGRGGWRLEESVLARFRLHMRYRRVQKVGDTLTRADYPVRVTLHRTPDGLADDLRRAARARNFKVHDILLAALADACGRFVPLQQRRNRRDVSVGSIVDLRPHAGADLSDTFGLYLGFTSVICQPGQLRDWDRLLKTVSAQNRVSKASGLPQGSMLWMAASMAVSPLVPDEKLYHFFRKELPMAGGLSNVNLNPTWVADHHPRRVIEYWRISPTGPLVPLVIATTTLGSRLALAVTCRQTLLTPEAEKQFVAHFVQRLERVATREESRR